MSQAKVDRYKEEKANRRKQMKKDKIKSILGKVLVVVVITGLVSWMGYSVYNIHESDKPRETVEVDYSAVDSYLNTLSE